MPIALDSEVRHFYNLAARTEDGKLDPDANSKLKEIQAKIKAGETTGDTLVDFCLATKGTLLGFNDVSKFTQEWQGFLEAMEQRQDQLFLLVDPDTWRIEQRRDDTLTMGLITPPFVSFNPARAMWSLVTPAVASHSPYGNFWHEGYYTPPYLQPRYVREYEDWSVKANEVASRKARGDAKVAFVTHVYSYRKLPSPPSGLSIGNFDVAQYFASDRLTKGEKDCLPDLLSKLGQPVDLLDKYIEEAQAAAKLKSA